MPRNQKIKNTVPSEMVDMKHISKNAIYSGAIAALGAYYLFDESGNSQVLGMTVPSSVAIGVGTGAGSALSDYIAPYVVDKLGSDNRFIDSAENNAIKLAVSGASGAAAMMALSNIPFSIEGFALSAGSKYLGDSVTNQIDPLSMLF